MLRNLSVPMPDNLPAALVKMALKVVAVGEHCFEAIREGKTIIVLGDPLEAAAAGIAIANFYGAAEPMTYIGYADATKFTNMKFNNHNLPLNQIHGTLEESLFGGDENNACEIVIWSMLSMVSEKAAHDIDAAIGDRMANGLCNIITGWNTSPERRISAEELRNFETRAGSPTGYPMLNLYANNEKFVVLVSAESVLDG